MTVVDIQVGAGADDGVWFEGGSQFFNNDTEWFPGGYLDSTYGRANSFACYRNVTIPQGSDIDVAYQRMRAKKTRSLTTVNAIWSAIDADDAAPPTTYSGAENATRTTATVAQNNLPFWGGGMDYDSSSLVTIIQEIVDRGGWASGNDIVIYGEDNVSTATDSTHRMADSYNGSTATAPKLHIEYTVSNTAPSISVAPSVSYGSLTRLGPLNTPATVTFTATDAEQTGAGALSYTIRTAATGGGTLVGSGTCTSGTAKQHNIVNADPGLVDGSQTLYLRVSDGTLFSADSSFTLLRDTGAPTVGTITHTPNPVVP